MALEIPNEVKDARGVWAAAWFVAQGAADGCLERPMFIERIDRTKNLSSKSAAQFHAEALCVALNTYIPAFVGLGEDVAAQDADARPSYHVVRVVLS